MTRSVWSGLVLWGLLIPLLAFAFGCGDEAPAPEPDPSSRRSLEQGLLVGFASPIHAAHVWKGIPFAAPPTGPLRWRAPRPPAPWEGRFEALTAGEPCVQFAARGEEVRGSEDCLTLDVYAPRFAASEVPHGTARLPVMVWIHGGGNTMGDASVYDGSRLAAEHDVIVVSIQYRLGVFGWLAHRALRASATNAEDASGNFGTLDTIRALEWVRDNISAFGGDPGAVTVFGESAGGINVYALLLSPRASGLFQRAISQSGILMSVAMEEAENFADDSETPGATGSSSEILLALMLADGRADDRAHAKRLLSKLSESEIEAYLRGKSAAELLRTFSSGSMGGMYQSPYVFRDGHVIERAESLQALATLGLHNAVPTIAGSNRDETRLFALFASPHLTRLFGLPFRLNDPGRFERSGYYSSLAMKAQCVDEPLAALSSGGRRDIWGYRFDWDEQGKLLWLDFSELLGAAHAVEILFVFGFMDLGRWTDTAFADPVSAEALSKRIRSYWANFAHTGDPGRGEDGELPRWEPWGPEPDAPKFLLLDSEVDGGLRMSSETVTVSEVRQRLESDPRVSGDEERCQLFADMVTYSERFTPEDYASFAGGLCSSFPYRSPLAASSPGQSRGELGPEHLGGRIR